MRSESLERLRETLAMLEEFSGRLGLSDADRAELHANLGTVKSEVVFSEPNSQYTWEALHRLLVLLESATADNRLARTIHAQLEDILAED